jgi:hypothetical protein
VQRRDHGDHAPGVIVVLRRHAAQGVDRANDPAAQIVNVLGRVAVRIGRGEGLAARKAP